MIARRAKKIAGPRANTKPDPVFALIDAHRVAALKFDGAVDIEQASLKGSPAEIANGKRVWNRAQSAVSSAMRRLCDTTPTTPAGLVAMLKYLERLFDETMGEEYRDGRTSNLWKTIIKFANALDETPQRASGGDQ